MEYSILIYWTSPFIILGVSGVLFLFSSFFIEILVSSVDPEYTPHSAASDLGLHCLPRSLKRDARLIWVNSHLVPSFFDKLPYLIMILFLEL